MRHAMNTLIMGLLFLGLVGCGGGTKHDRTKATAPTGAALGDLSAYKQIAEDTLGIVEKGDLAAAKARIKDLETAWDNAEEKLKPMNPEKWTSVDKSIDRALADLRSGQPDAAACRSSLNTLIAKFNAIDKQP
jgi:hypothetical protein